MTKVTSALVVLLAVVVGGGIVYLLRPEAERELEVAGEVADDEEAIEEVPADDTVGWPPKSPADDVTLVHTLVQVTLRTSLGDIELLLDGERAPLAVGNFVALAEKDFYDGTTFHRVIPDFMIQGGDPLSRDAAAREQHGTGGPGYTFVDEINAESYGLHEQPLRDVVQLSEGQELNPEYADWTLQQYYEAQGYQYTTEVTSLPMRRGVVAMANAGPNTNGSQFFIIVADSVPHLAGKHTPFGAVQGGMEVVDAIVAVERDERDNPVEPVVVEDVIVRQEGDLVDGLEAAE